MPANRKITNKTAHVLNVITAGQEAEDVPAAAPVPTTAPPVSPPTAVPSTMVEVEHAHEELSDQIREALSEELARGEEDSFSVFQPETVQISHAAPVASASPSAPSTAAQQPLPSVKAQSSLPVRQSSNLTQAKEIDGIGYINIMQALVDEKAPKYIQLLGVCPCSRCLADVKALALSHLEPKYIVVRKSQKLLYSAYENHYNAAVISQLISACRVVIGNPRH
ncbi:late competence development ComFB family protein [Oscillibacter sp.]|uniref:late competence development ComFB family protein n=1 Tax=Oscillibacter sp. TaxID=1945593 RepID=UPI00339A9961